MRQSRRYIGERLTIAAALLVFVARAVLAQGPLDPTEAPGPTMKSLTEVEPRINVATLPDSADAMHVISEPGSYYLAGNIQAETNRHGIRIDCDNVTLDLAGFTLSGAGAASGTAGNGVETGSRDEIVVCNGIIRAFFGEGINGNNGNSLVAERLIVEGCGSVGIHGYEDVAVRDCTARQNGSDGILANGTLLAVNCVAAGNGGTGISASGHGTVLRGCVARDNDGWGISAGHGSVVTDCAARENHNGGISVKGGSSLTACAASGNEGDYGIYAYVNSSLRGCTAYGNTGSGSFCAGIYAADCSTVIGCTARYNSWSGTDGTASQGIGIYAGYSGTVKDCTVAYNEGDGIRIDSQAVVCGNTCNFNGYGSGDGAGIHAITDDNRIEANAVIENDRGIDVDAAGNFIVRNSASGNGVNYDFVGTQTAGPIVSAGAITNTNPWANFEF